MYTDLNMVFLKFIMAGEISGPPKPRQYIPVGSQARRVLQCFAIKTAVAFFERAAKSTVLAGIGFLCLRTEHKPNNLSRSISSCHCIVLNMVPSTSIEMHKVMVRWCFEQYKIAFEISVLFPAARSEQL